MLMSVARHELCTQCAIMTSVTCTASLLCFLWHCRHWQLVILLALYYVECGTGRCL